MNASKVIKFVNWLLINILVLIIWQMFSIKGQVQDFNFQLQQLNSQLNQEYKQLNILKAELSYLQSPERLRILANKYLDLTPVQTAQLINDPLTGLQSNLAILEEFAHSYNTKHTYSKWHYKKTPHTSNKVSAPSAKIQKF